MEEIEVGEYVRTRKGDICKVLGINSELKNGRVYSHQSYILDNRKGSLTKAYILKHSKNIIDLIELGDYVNGKKVTGILINRQGADCRAIQADTKVIYNNFIKTIVTKEQFKSVEYRLEE